MNRIKSTIADFLQGVRIQGTRAAPLFCVRDIAERLGLTRGGIMASAWRLPASERKYRILQTPSGLHLHLFITSTGFLRLAMAGLSPESKAFRDKIAGISLPKELRPVEMALIKSKPPEEVMALPIERREHILFWINVTAEIAGSRRRNETIRKMARKYRLRGGASEMSCYRYFKRWVESGGDWRVFERWQNFQGKSRL